MSSSLRNRHNSLLAIVAIVLALSTGCSNATQAPSTAPTSGSSAVAVSEPEEAPSPIRGDESVPSSLSVMNNSRPVSVEIPAIATESILIDLGLNTDGTVEVPGTEPGSPAGWYHGSPTPGERGPAILLGHVNATGGGPGVFSGLRQLGEGDVINITREDGSVAAFRFIAGSQYSKSSFPSDLVYGDTPGSELRLVTCDGFNVVTGAFDDNYVVYAELITPTLDGDSS